MNYTMDRLISLSKSAQTVSCKNRSTLAYLWKSCFDEYSKYRKPDGDGVQDLSMHNFVVMRDKTADPQFLLQKKIELKFSKKYPEKWLPLYSMVSFSNIRYSDAWKIGQQQEALMQKIMSIPNIEGIWDSESVEQTMLSLID